MHQASRNYQIDKMVSQEGNETKYDLPAHNQEKRARALAYSSKILLLISMRSGNPILFDNEFITYIVVN